MRCWISRPTSVDPVKAILSTSGVIDERAAGRAVAGDDVDDAGRQFRLLEDLGQHEGTQRRRLGRLQDAGVARGQGRREFPRRHQQREVPRDDLPGDTERPGIRAEAGVVELVGPAGVVEEVRGGQRDVDVARFADGLAVVERLDDGQLARALLDQSGDAKEVLRALRAGRLGPDLVVGATRRRSRRGRRRPRSPDATMASDSSFAGLTVANCSWDCGVAERPVDEEPVTGLQLGDAADSGAGSYSSEPSCELASCRSLTSVPAEFVGANVGAALLLRVAASTGRSTATTHRNERGRA